MKKIYLFMYILIIVLIVSGCSKKATIEVFNSNNVIYTTKVEENRFQVYKNGNWQELIVKGVNLEPVFPGKQKFEISQKEYLKWFEKIGEMNANTVRIYEIYPPEFYEALEQYNRKNEKIIYLLQGVTLDNDTLLEIPDTFKLDNIVPFKDEIDRAIDVIHGKASIDERESLAYGKYKTDVSPYILGWILGLEWQPEMVDNVNKTRLDKGEFSGDFVYTEEARPFEHFLAEIMDHTLAYEMDKYGWQRPISFVNWATTDLLKHSFEPVKEEDMVSINPNVIKLRDNNVGQFASYHIYPYYPEFLNLDPKYNMYIDHRGKTNNFAGYLKDLIRVHDIPVLIAEFGVPSARGLERVSVHGLNKGFLTENQQGGYLSTMYEDIIYEGAMGGVISDWQDTWSIWSDAQKTDGNFGLISFDRNKIKIDGDIKDWKSNKSTPLFTLDKKEEHFIKNVYMDQDERYLYFGIEYKDLKTKSIDTTILLDIIPYQGNLTNPFNKNIITENGTDFVINIKSTGTSKVLVDSYYDSHYFQYSKYLADSNPEFKNKGNEIYNPIRSTIREELVSFKTGQKIPFMNYETGILKQGNGNPGSKDYDSLADYYVNKDKNFVEVRIPWSLIGFKDPSKKIIQGDFYVNGIDSILIINDIKINISAYLSDDIDSYYTVPEITYTWDNWDKPVIEERLKESYYIIKEKFSEY